MTCHLGLEGRTRGIKAKMGAIIAAYGALNRAKGKRVVFRG